MTSASPGPLSPRLSLEAHIGLALGLAARPGITAVLAGAGLSVAAGVPAVWEVQRELLSRAAAAAGDDPEDVFEWWRERTGTDAAYDKVLFATAPTPLARKDMLRSFFEPTEREREEGIKVPSDAHRALAEMMRDGLIRIIVTLNFDLLIENALRDLGVEPTIVSTVDDVRGMEPLHAQTNLVWHLHGDYTNPEMLNTPDELREYDAVVNDRLDELLDQYGLLVIGWSATWDPALRAAISRCSSRRYPTTWLSRSSLSDEAQRLAIQRDATVVEETADVWLRRLVEGCSAIRERNKEPLATVASVAALKRELTRSTRPIIAHDRVQAEMQRIGGLSVMNQAALNSMTYAERIPVLEAELEMWAGFVGVLAFWGNADTDGWWSPYLERYGNMPPLSGATDAIESFTSPAVVTLYAGGVAAMAAERWDLVCDLLMKHPISEPYRSGRAPASAVIGPSTMYAGRPWPSRRLAVFLGPILSGVVGMGTTPTLEAWERFEYVCWIVNADRNLRDVPYTMAWPLPYVRVTDDASEELRVRSLASTWLSEHSAARSMVLDRLFDGDEDRLSEAMRQSNASISQSVHRTEMADLMRRGGSGWMPSGIRRAMILPNPDQSDWPPNSLE